MQIEVKLREDREKKDESHVRVLIQPYLQQLNFALLTVFPRK